MRDRTMLRENRKAEINNVLSQISRFDSKFQLFLFSAIIRFVQPLTFGLVFLHIWCIYCVFVSNSIFFLNFFSSSKCALCVVVCLLEYRTFIILSIWRWFRTEKACLLSWICNSNFHVEMNIYMPSDFHCFIELTAHILAMRIRIIKYWNRDQFNIILNVYLVSLSGEREQRRCDWRKKDQFSKDKFSIAPN